MDLRGRKVCPNQSQPCDAVDDNPAEFCIFGGRSISLGWRTSLPNDRPGAKEKRTDARQENDQADDQRSDGCQKTAPPAATSLARPING